jgi:hypothetical protein
LIAVTIVVGVATPEGLVLASDSRATLVSDNDRHRIASDSVQKVFRIGGRFGVANYGALLIGGESVGGLMDQFEASLGDPPPDNAAHLAERLGTFFTERLNASLEEDEEWDLETQGIALGFLVAGYDSEGVGHLHHVTVPETDAGPGASTATRGMLWQGQHEAINRLIYGYDATRLAATGLEVSEEMVEALGGIQYSLNLPLTIQDGVDCACFLVRTVVDMQRFSVGTVADAGSWEVPGCGGPVQVLAVERSGSRWVEQLELTAPKRPAAAEGELT